MGRRKAGPISPLKSASKAAPPSMEQLMFRALEEPAETDFLSGQNDEDALAEMNERFSAGTLVEIRRSNIRAIGIVLYTILSEGVWKVHSLTSRGEVWAHLEQDVQFQIPNFVSRELAEDCGMQDGATTEAELNARVAIMKRVRDFEKRFEYDLHTVQEKARAIDFYNKVCHPDSTTWVDITVPEVAKKLIEGRRDFTPVELFAVQSYLMDHGYHYVVDSRRFLQTQRFWVRPRSEIETIKTVHQMCLSNDPAVDAFAEKTRELVFASRKRAVESWHEPPSRHPLSSVQFTEKDKAILRLLVMSLRARRLLQADPFISPVAHILKKVGVYDAESYGEHLVVVLLMEMGVLAPWQEIITREELQVDQLERDTLTFSPSGQTPLIPQAVGEEDFYSRDIVDPIRHDFGDLAVYVIDDWGAEELDDGVSVERDSSNPDHIWLHVHIADPTVLLPPTHRLARDAFRLAESRYLLDRTVPMLPRNSFHEFSLGHAPGQPDKVLTFSAKIDAAGDIVDYKVRPAVIRNVRTVKYAQVDALLGVEPLRAEYPFHRERKTVERPLELSSFDPSAVENFRLLQQTTNRLVESRTRKNAITITFPTLNLELKPRPLPSDLLGDHRLEPSAFRGFPELVYGVANSVEVGGRLLVSECMKAAGRVASLFFRDRGIPALRRSVGPLHSELVGGVEALLAERQPDSVVDYYAPLRHQVRAPSGRYLTTPGPHSLLGIPQGEGYMKVTSPLRRFGDILAHWQIKHALLAEAGEKASPILFSEDWLARFGSELELRELEVKRLIRWQIEYWAHLYLLRWLNDPAAGQREHDPLRNLTAHVLGLPAVNYATKDYICKVYLPDLGLRGRIVGIPSGSQIQTGDTLDVKVKEVKLGTRPLLDLVLR
ncbi:RNB-domain-containing protein [Trametes punicea]|nr:RNB-domain-containing protein [Trametes punicea]